MAGYLDKVEVGLDVASSEFKVEGENAYDLDFKTTGPEKDTSLKLSGDELMALYKDIADRYPIVTMEDPFDQNGQNQPSVADERSCFQTSVLIFWQTGRTGPSSPT